MGGEYLSMLSLRVTVPSGRQDINVASAADGDLAASLICDRAHNQCISLLVSCQLWINKLIC